ncbi:hypothetical protein SAMN02910358_01527 [Lachnospiraceae bacterium XBB1006]|nr:hypothetical protein SAMN02910358_01527 [Lachnospiraceae bacterium XBB1006]
MSLEICKSSVFNSFKGEFAKKQTLFLKKFQKKGEKNNKAWYNRLWAFAVFADVLEL